MKSPGAYSEIEPAKVRPPPAPPRPLQLAAKSEKERWETLEFVLGQIARSSERAEANAEAANENTARMVRSMVETNRGLEALAARLGVVESKPSSGASGVLKAVADRASQSEAAIVEQLRVANEALRAERDARIAEDRRRLDEQIEAQRARRAWISRVVWWATVGGGLLAIIAAGVKACGG